MCWCVFSRKLMNVIRVCIYDDAYVRRKRGWMWRDRNEWWSKLEIGCKRVWKTTTHRPVSFLLHPISHILFMRLVIWKAKTCSTFLLVEWWLFYINFILYCYFLTPNWKEGRTSLWLLCIWRFNFLDIFGSNGQGSCVFYLLYICSNRLLPLSCWFSL